MKLQFVLLKALLHKAVLDSYIDADQAATEPTRLRYFSQDRISVEPGTTITIINDDLVSHSILSGKENYNDRNDPFTPDGRISTGNILTW